MNADEASLELNPLILVHEPVSHWTAEMERAFAVVPDVSFRWRPYRKELLEEVPRASLLLLVVGIDDASLDLIGQLKAVCPSVPIACLIPQPNHDWEWLARELGVDIILPDTSEKERVAHSLCRRLRIGTAIPG